VTRLFFGLWLTAYAAQGSILMTSTVGVGGFDASIRIGGGSGTIFAIVDNGGNVETLCIVTADHVLSTTAPTTIGIRGSGNGGFDVTAVSSVQRRGGPTGKEDLAFVGFTIDLNKINNIDEVDTLASITPETLGSAPASTPFDIQAYGYGATARPTTNFEKIDYMGAIYVHPLNDPAYAYGTERTYTNTIKQFGNYNQKGYQYNDMSYSFNDSGDGLGLGGDSGSGLIANGNVVGVYTRAQSQYFDDAAMPCQLESGNCTAEAIYKGAVGSGLAFTGSDVEWLNQKGLPEPSTWVLLLTGLAAMPLAVRLRPRPHPIQTRPLTASDDPRLPPSRS